jgi:purine catabolism regulator
MDVMRAAEAMHLHHNTVRYRLTRVEQLMGRPLKDPATIASLYIALAAAPPDLAL